MGEGTKTLLSVVGARPNFMKLAPVARALDRRPDVRHVIVHTGQHYDHNMAAAFFTELEIPEPDYHLGVGSGTHAQQTAAVMERLEPVCLKEAPDAVLVYGDVNSTVAAALVAVKLGTGIAHVEAGLRSGDWSMPEEINRVVTDRLSQWLFTPTREAADNLRAEGAAAERIHFVGNVMIDTLVHALPRARQLDAPAAHGVRPNEYAVATLHRPSNVDDPATLRELVAALAEVGRHTPVIFPAHPRTLARLRSGEVPTQAALRLVEPLGYVEMLSLVLRAKVVITDSGGLQEETTFLGVPCLTVRPNTERPITCTQGTNQLVTPTRRDLLAAVRTLNGAGRQATPRIELWDGRTADRIVGALV